MTPSSDEVRPTEERRRHWTAVTSFGLAFGVLYVAGIGPLASLEARGCFHPKTWDHINLIYTPVLWSWKHGPDWWARTLSGYTSYFHTPQSCGPSMATHYFATHNKAQAYRYMKRWFAGSGIREPDLSRRMQEFERRNSNADDFRKIAGVSL